MRCISTRQVLRALPNLTTTTRQMIEDICPNKISAIRNAQGRCIAFYKCPHCQAQESSDCKAFQYEDLDTKHQCLQCGKRKPVKEWRCECNVTWHICHKHRYAKACDSNAQNQSKATNGQASPANSQNAKRAKVNRQASLTIMADADDIRVRANKRKRNENQEDSDHDGNHYAIEPGRIDLKRKREPEPNAIVDLGPSNLRILNPNLYSSALRRRLNLGGSPKG